MIDAIRLSRFTTGVSGEQADLRAFSRFLAQQRVSHRVFEQGDEIVVAVADADSATLVRQLYTRWREGEFGLPAATPSTPAMALHIQWRALPCTISLIVLSVVCWPLTGGIGEAPGTLLPWFTFQGIEMRGDFLLFADLWHNILQGEIWRLVTPALMHFGGLHLLFNMAWLWEFGRRIERVEGALVLLGAVAVIAVVSNTAQALVTVNNLFGGMSGVVYGLMGYLLVSHRLRPVAEYQLPAPLSIMMLAMLVLFSFNVGAVFGVHIANTAHWTGLIAGCVLGLARALTGKARAP